jgi:phosphoglycerate dehydrogenase-like enzyme
VCPLPGFEKEVEIEDRMFSVPGSAKTPQGDPRRRATTSGGAMTTSPILVTGGTGTLGRLVVRRLKDAGRDVRVLSRSSREAEEGIESVAVTTRRGPIRMLH